MKKVWLLIGLGLALVAVLLWVIRTDHREPPEFTGQFARQPATNKSVVVEAITNDTNLNSSSPLDQKVEQLKKEARDSFQKLLDRLPLYATTNGSGETRMAAAQRTNSDGSVKVEVGVQLGNYRASFVSGPISTNGLHVNPSLPDGSLLRLFESLSDGSDTRRNPESMSTWYRSTGQWTEQEAVDQTMRMLERLGVPASRVAKHRFRPSTMTVKNPAGETVRVTPFYRVDVYDKTDVDDADAGFLYVEYRMDQSPPGKVTRLSMWPPVKIP